MCKQHEGIDKYFNLCNFSDIQRTEGHLGRREDGREPADWSHGHVELRPARDLDQFAHDEGEDDLGEVVPGVQDRDVLAVPATVASPMSVNG